LTQSSEDDARRLAEILRALEDMAAGELDRRAPISPAHDAIDAIAYTVNVLVGELHLTVERLAKAERESSSANEQKSLFLRNVSHEIRTPLAAILSYAGLLARTPLDTGQRDAVERIRSNGDALRHLTEDLLDLARIEAGKLQLALEPVSPADVAVDVVQSLLLQAKGKGLSLMLSMAPDVPGQIVTDARRLRQILMNLVGNAVKFTDAGEVVVSLRPDDRTSELVIDVTDSGIGLSDEEQRRLFSTFVQKDADRGGIGLGLVLARELGRQLGGDLQLVSSQPGRGSRFRLTLAMAQRSDQPPAQAPPSGTPDLRGVTVLFAEDNVDILESYSLLLESVGCTVAGVSNGLEAIDRAAAQRFDVVLMDMQMPTLNGLEATRRLRQSGFAGPILALSAHVMSEDRERFLEAGCNDHIAKPIDIDQLLARLIHYCPNR
jgi:signal transduction histidine kinase